MIYGLFFAVIAAGFADSTNTLYADRNPEALTFLYDTASSREHELLCRYRLYPLTQDVGLLSDLPATLPDGTARERALLSGLWGYRTARAALPAMIRNGRRAERLLQKAVDADPDEPLVLLIRGQSLMFKPRFAGGDIEASLASFLHLRDVLQSRSSESVSIVEADVWIWYAMDRLKQSGADKMRADLLAANPPALFRAFLLDPP